MRLYRNKKGTGVDNFFVMISFFVTAIIVLIMALFWSNIANVDYLWSQADQGATIKNNTQGFVDQWDFIMVCLYFGTHLAILALAFLLRSHPVIYLVALGMMILLVIIAAPLSNRFAEIAAEDAFSTVITDFPMTQHIMSKLPLYEFIWAVLTAIITFGLARYEEVI